MPKCPPLLQFGDTGMIKVEIVSPTTFFIEKFLQIIHNFQNHIHRINCINHQYTCTQSLYMCSDIFFLFLNILRSCGWAQRDPTLLPPSR